MLYSDYSKTTSILMSIMNWPSAAGKTPAYFSYILLLTLLLQISQPVQSIALSNLCGQFGHSCFGGNWGKRDLTTSSTTPEFLQSNLEINDSGPTISPPIYDENAMKHFLSEQLEMNLFRERLRQLLESE